MKKKNRKRQTKADRQRAARDKYMRKILSLPDSCWDQPAEGRCHGIYRVQASHNEDLIRFLTTTKGVRFRIIN
jgi:transposase InsO family protein